MFLIGKEEQFETQKRISDESKIHGDILQVMHTHTRTNTHTHAHTRTHAHVRTLQTRLDIESFPIAYGMFGSAVGIYTVLYRYQ